MKKQADVSLLAPGQRILSVDALRGFDMFWIVGGAELVSAIIKLFREPVQTALLPQFDHAAWAGFTFFDLIFPLFLFLVGMSTVFSLGKILAQPGKWAAYKRVLKRAGFLYLLGIFYYGGLSHLWPEIRLLGVLQRIAWCYLFTGILVIHFRWRGLITTTILLLVGYWAFLSLVPVPGQTEISFAAGQNWANYLDKHYLIGFKWDGDWDPEGLLSTLPAIVTSLLGVFAAKLLLNPNLLPKRKVLYFIGGGILGVALGYLWGCQFPVIKKIWTSSYVLVAGGYSFILLGIFYWLIDIQGWQKWSQPFVWIGTNAITIYLAVNLIDFYGIARRLANGDIYQALGEPVGNLVLATVTVGLMLALVHFLYRRKIFLRL
ncbi:DUF5009 domain-containing protein [candidate division KSB1 bacterium]|nr:DUF5009 domain-containing protein [candidate division KSB1 bacterium]